MSYAAALYVVVVFFSFRVRYKYGTRTQKVNSLLFLAPVWASPEISQYNMRFWEDYEASRDRKLAGRVTRCAGP